MQNINQEVDKKDKKKDENAGKIYEDGYIASITFLGNTKTYYFHTYDESIKENQPVVVETIHGVELGTVVKGSTPITEYKRGLVLRPILRIAKQEDIDIYARNIEKSKEALAITEECVNRLQLNMRLLKVDYTLDSAKVTIVYAAENRVDFRELLKELATKLHCRIELRQIGTRDRSKIVGGIGICGLPLCCNTFLGEFDGISINIAKNQFLVLNIQKLSGHCGKLICCLKYEENDYNELRKVLPKIGQKIIYEGSQYRVTSINVLTRQARLENKENVQEITIDQLVKITPKDSQEERKE